MKAIILALIIPLAVAHARLAPKPTEYEGTVVACNEKGIMVQGRIGTRWFPFYPGTVLGKGHSQKISDFKPGVPVKVVFSEITGIVKAENVRTNTPKPPPKPAKKK